MRSKLIVLFSFFTLSSIQETFAWCDWFKFGVCEVTLPISCGNNCSLSGWVNESGQVLNGLFSKLPLSELAQNIVAYLLGFISLIAVLYIIYAWFQIMIWAGDEEKVKKAKNIILYVILGIIIMWLAYSIVGWILGLVNTPTK